ncbi:MAG: phenylalanine--tRNA ligase subunit alpha [Zetaproteobacteria bacterium]|nr:phenylalanine--tRNA ligase subunit alpha [Pseudobdellovibrionaceae bacterium]
MTDNTIASLEKEATSVENQFQSNVANITANPTPKSVDELRIAYLGRKGKVSALMEGMRHLAKEDRPAAGKAVNNLRQKVESAIEDLIIKANEWQLQQKLNQSPLDVTLPVKTQTNTGSLHPVTLMRRTLLREFRRLGFTVVDGPEVDLDFYNFSALNFKDDHPARDMQDTFFIDGRDKTVLRTHTSNIQIHAMLENSPPLRVVAPGRTYRCDSDLTHTPMFHQIEGFIVDERITMGDMKGVIDKFLKAIYGEDLSTRVRPSYFPFVEPGGEFDLQCVKCRGKGCRICSKTGWLEIGGMGMIHPNVFEAVSYDSEKYTGFAFGFGIDRLAMLKYGVTDLRLMFEGNKQFLSQFPIHS